VALLERLSFSSEDLPKAYHHLATLDGVRGAVILSTCNRVELASEVESYHVGLQALRGFLAESRDVSFEELAEPLVSHYEEEAVKHLFALAAGIDSMVVGEPHILAQVREAVRAAEAEGAVSPVLGSAFRRAIRVGRRSRAETRIGANPAAMVEAGAAVAERELGSLAGRRLLVVGAGTMAELVVRSLGERGVDEVVVLNRTPSRAARLAGRTGGAAGRLEDLPGALARADLVVSVTGATGLVIERATVAHAMTRREGRPVFCLDLAVPRDVDPSVRDLPGVFVADIDDLREIVNGEAGDEVERVRAIVDEEAHRFAEWRRAARLAPLIQDLYDRADQIRRAELRRLDARLASLTDEERRAVEAATSAIVKKLLHRPVVRAKELSEDDVEVRLFARLFDLDPPPPA
jgi:glutamyl-tRNA reductase